MRMCSVGMESRVPRRTTARPYPSRKVNMKKTKVGLLLLACSVFTFLLGSGLGAYRERSNQHRVEQSVSQLNAMSFFQTLAEISENISAGRVKEAKCVSDVTASVYFRELQSCLADSSCRSTIEDQVKKSAPSLLSGDKSKFTYYENQQKCASR